MSEFSCSCDGGLCRCCVEPSEDCECAAGECYCLLVDGKPVPNLSGYPECQCCRSVKATECICRWERDEHSTWCRDHGYRTKPA